MARVVEHDGQQYRVKARHGWTSYLYEDGGAEPRRFTQVWIAPVHPIHRAAVDEVLVGAAICRPPDQFCKRTGRRLATIKLLAALKERGWTSEERKAVFDTVCPEYRTDDPEVVAWDVALTDEEIEQLGAGVDPRLIRPDRQVRLQ